MDNLNYWRWLVRGTGGKSGARRLADTWLIVHLAIGAGLSYIVPVTLQECASVVLLPLAGVIVGITFAWVGNAQALLQTSEIDKLAEFHEGGFADYVYIYQLAIMLIFGTLIFWSLSGLYIFDTVWPVDTTLVSYRSIKAFGFALTSIALRECWHVVLGAHWMLMARREVKRIDRHK